LFFGTKDVVVRKNGRSGTLRNYNLALTRQVPQSFVNAISKHSQNEEPVCVPVAQKQHDIYTEKLRFIVPTFCLPSLESFPDSVFLEDTVVAIGKKAVISNMGHPSRRGEEASVREILLQLGVQVVDMKALNPKAFCDGGDVLFTGRHLFVGISERTNHSGLDVLQEVFDSVKVVAVPLGDKALHLKSVVTNLDDATLVAPIGALGDFVIQQMRLEDRGYSFVRLPELRMCNVVSLNGSVLAQDAPCQESRGRLQRAAEHRNLKLEFVDTSEFAKCDGALTCCSILLKL
jgi:dimethylargininase